MAADVSATRNPLLIAPPPMLFGIAFAAGMLAQTVYPLAPLPIGAARALGAAAIVLAVAGAAWSVGTFLRQRTTLNPMGQPSQLIVAGPYRISRNPMYVALVVAYLGGTVLAAAAWPLILLPLPVLVVAGLVVPREEARMELTFGKAYRDYCLRVRRWL